MASVIAYFKNSIQEFNNITWPTKNQAVRISAVVLGFMVASAVVFGALDQLLTLGYQALIKLNIKF